jgi:hypothetical protein
MAEVNFSITSSTTFTYLAYNGLKERSCRDLSTNERGIYQSESMGAELEADGDPKDHQQLETYLGPPPMSGINHTSNITKSS